MKKTILFLIILFLSLPVFAIDDLTPVGGSPVQATLDSQTQIILTKLQATVADIDSKVNSLQGSSITAQDLNVFQMELLNNVKRVQNQSIIEMLFIEFIFAIFIFAVIALAKARRLI